jgi:hypothetical protein
LKQAAWAQFANHRPASLIVCRFCFPLVQRAKCKTVAGPQRWGKPKWRGVKQINAWSIVSCSASIASGTNKAAMDEQKVVHITGWSFGLLASMMLGLTILNNL